uniref:Uncharacterized protein n=1 Tax=Globisporangium ultimum (strain ATCC 200006 / CBS 805.95 / DAOM BR144) TaxID=431595 RepID=K3WST2_GLOUD
MERCFEVRGKVQNTVVRVMIKRGLVGGASNGKADKALVRLTLLDESERIDAFMELLRKGMQLNDWARAPHASTRSLWTLTLRQRHTRSERGRIRQRRLEELEPKRHRVHLSKEKSILEV